MFKVSKFKNIFTHDMVYCKYSVFFGVKFADPPRYYLLVTS